MYHLHTYFRSSPQRLIHNTPALLIVDIRNIPDLEPGTLQRDRCDRPGSLLLPVREQGIEKFRLK
jgi:hypothetical protein